MNQERNCKGNFLKPWDKYKQNIAKLVGCNENCAQRKILTVNTYTKMEVRCQKNKLIVYFKELRYEEPTKTHSWQMEGNNKRLEQR